MSKYTEERIAVLGSVNGSIYDYYLDKGIKCLNIYATEEYADSLASIYSQAFWLGIEIKSIYCEKETEIGVTFFENTFPMNVKAIEISDKLDNELTSEPFVLLRRYIPDMHNNPNLRLEFGQFRFPEDSYTFTELFEYSVKKRILLDKIIEYKEKFAENLKLVVLQFPTANQIINPNEHEKDLINGVGHWLIKSDEGFKAATGLNFNPKEVADYREQKIYFGCERGGTVFLEDYISENINIIGGYRHTVDSPQTAVKTVYSFGFCNALGSTCTDENTIPSTLQRKLNRYFKGKSDFKVLNCANGGGPGNGRQCSSFLYHKPGNGDVALFIHEENDLIYENYKDKIFFVRPRRENGLFDRPHDLGQIYSTHTHHFTDKGSRTLGEALADRMLEFGIFDKFYKIDDYTDNIVSGISKLSLLDIISHTKATVNNSVVNELISYIQKVKLTAPRIGSIVMNCNPFTLGHLYLIEESAKKVSELIIFVVEEGSTSQFPFEVRIELVRKGTAHLPNITVLPSGGFIISRTTFPIYFDKDIKNNTRIDPSVDVEIFARHIASALGITVRFAGDEPFDYITRQYNETMQRILPSYGIDFEIIPRKEIEGEVISASHVRKLLETKNFSAISQIVPKTTMEYLRGL